MGRGPTKSIDWLHVASSSPLDRSVGESPARSAADTRTEDVFAARLFMPFKWASISEMVHTGEALASAALMAGGGPRPASRSSKPRADGNWRFKPYDVGPRAEARGPAPRIHPPDAGPFSPGPGGHRGSERLQTVLVKCTRCACSSVFGGRRGVYGVFAQ